MAWLEDQVGLAVAAGQEELQGPVGHLVDRHPRRGHVDVDLVGGVDGGLDADRHRPVGHDDALAEVAVGVGELGDRHLGVIR